MGARDRGRAGKWPPKANPIGRLAGTRRGSRLRLSFCSSGREGGGQGTWKGAMLPCDGGLTLMLAFCGGGECRGRISVGKVITDVVVLGAGIGWRSRRPIARGQQGLSVIMSIVSRARQAKNLLWTHAGILSKADRTLRDSTNPSLWKRRLPKKISATSTAALRCWNPACPGRSATISTGFRARPCGIATVSRLRPVRATAAARTDRRLAEST